MNFNIDELLINKMITEKLQNIIFRCHRWKWFSSVQFGTPAFAEVLSVTLVIIISSGGFQ